MEGQGVDGQGVKTSTIARAAGAAVVALAGALLAGCAQEARSGDPGARPLPPGMTCPSIKSEMDRLVSRGVPSAIERRQAGGRLTPQQNADADRYNELLSYYLGGRCHA
jgi:hypothetical protein